MKFKKKSRIKTASFVENQKLLGNSSYKEE
jgi:hypothetical protein